MVNQIVIPAPGAGGTFQPQFTQPAATPFAKGDPPEGPVSFLSAVTIPAGETRATLTIDVSMVGMSMVQSLLVDNEANAIPVSIKCGTGVNFGIQPLGTQIIPVFLRGTTLAVTMTITDAQAEAVVVALQVFNSFVPPASWVSNLAVAGDVTVAAVSGDVNVTVSGAQLLGVGILAQTEGGASGMLLTALSNTVTSIKSTGAGTFKGFCVSSQATGYLQMFDASSPGVVTLGTTTPTWSFPVGPAGPTPCELALPPEGLAFAAGLQAAWTTTLTGSTAPAQPVDGTIFYA
jgi:hypothetical protein